MSFCQHLESCEPHPCHPLASCTPGLGAVACTCRYTVPGTWYLVQFRSFSQWRETFIWSLSRHGYGGDGVQSCEVGLSYFTMPTRFQYTFHLVSFKVVTTPAPPRLAPPPTKSPCSLTCGQNAHCKVPSFKNLKILSFSLFPSTLLSQNHHRHHVESGKTLCSCTTWKILLQGKCPRPNMMYDLHQVDGGKTLCECPSGYTGDPRVRCQLKTKWYNVNVTV